MNKCVIKIGMLVLLVTSFLTCSAQYYQQTQYSEDDGILQNAIYSIDQDEKGMIWIGTDRGVYRFNGVEFDRFEMKDGLSDNEVFQVCNLKNGVGFFNTFAGKPNIRCREKFYNTTNHKGLANLHFGSIPLVTRCGSNQIIATTKGSDSILRLSFSENGQFQKEVFDLNCGKIVSIYFNGEYLYLVSFKNDIEFLFKYSKEMELVSKVHFTKLGYKTVYFQDSSLAFLDTKKVFMSRRLDTVQTDLPSFEILDHPATIIYNYRVFGQEHWLATFKGILIFRNGKYIRTLFKDIKINTMFRDRDSNIWVGTAGHGLFLIRKKKLQNFDHKKLKTKGIINCIAEQNDQIFLGFDKPVLVRIIGDKWEKIDLRLPKEQRTEFSIREIQFLKQDQILLATGEGILNYDLTRNTSQWLSCRTSSKCVIIDTEKIWYGSHNAISSIHRKTKELKEYSLMRTVSLERGSNGELWIGGKTGLYYLGEDGKKVRKFRGGMDDKRVMDMDLQNQYLWIASNAGAFRLNISTGNVQSIHSELEGVSCFKIKQSNDTVWVASGQGIYRLVRPFEPESQLTRFTTSEGLLSDMVFDFLLRKDSIWAVGRKGLSVFHTHEVLEKAPSEVSIIDIINKNRSYLHTGIFPAGTKDIMIRFASPTFGRKVAYRYTLHSNNDEWSFTHKNSVTFSELPPGDYKFSVYAVDHNGKKSVEVTSYPFEILPFFYQTNWFMALCVAIFIAILVALMYRRLRKVRQQERQKNQIEKKLASLELEAIKAQINPHFIYNCLNSIKLSVVKNDTETAEDQLSIFAKLIRETLDYSKLDFISLEQEINYLNRYLNMEKARFKETLKVELTNTVENPYSVLLPSMLIQPYVENAVKHGLDDNEKNGSRIRVGFEQRDGRLICTIEDTGKGINTNQNGRAVPSGISISSTRAETYNTLYGIDIQIEIINKRKMNTNGTIVNIAMPLLNHSNRNQYESLYNRR